MLVGMACERVWFRFIEASFFETRTCPSVSGGLRWISRATTNYLFTPYEIHLFNLDLLTGASYELIVCCLRKCRRRRAIPPPIYVRSTRALQPPLLLRHEVVIDPWLYNLQLTLWDKRSTGNRDSSLQTNLRHFCDIISSSFLWTNKIGIDRRLERNTPPADANHTTPAPARLRSKRDSVARLE